MPSNPYSDIAGDYLKAGWQAPLPLPYGKKEKPPNKYTGQKAPYPTIDQINEWCADKPQNICIRCSAIGDAFEIVGIDVDHYTKGSQTKTGFDQLRDLEDKLGALPDTWVSSARTDGKSGIRFFLIPAGLKVRGQIDKDIEAISRGYRYAVVWPSVHPEGGQYWWYPPGAEPSESEKTAWDGEVPEPSAFPGLPDTWVDFLTNGRRLITDADEGIDKDTKVDEIYDWATETFHGNDDSEPCSKMQAKLDKHLEKVKHTATFHDLLTNAHWNLIHLAYEGHHGWYQAVKVYENAYIEDKIKRGQDSVAEIVGEIRRSREKAFRKIKARMCDKQTAIGASPVLASCYSTGECKPQNIIIPFSKENGDDADDDEFEEAVNKQVRWLETQREAKRRLAAKSDVPFARSPTSLTNFLAQPANPTPMRIDSLMPDAGRVVFSAPYKAGKTTAVGNLIRSLVDGDAFLDTFKVNKPAKHLVLIDNELSEHMVRDWLLKQGIKTTDAVADVICLRGQVSTFDIINDQRRSEWATYLRQIECDYLIFDCLRPSLDALGLDENHDAGKFLTAYDELLSEAQIGGDSTIVHHMGHTGERSRGDSRIQDWPDAIWKLVRENSDDELSPRYFSATGRDVEVTQGLITYDPQTRHLSYSAADRNSAKKKRRTDVVVTEILNILSAARKAGEIGVTQNKLVEGTRKVTGIGEPTIKSVLGSMVDDGSLVVNDGNNNAKVYSAAIFLRKVQ